MSPEPMNCNYSEGKLQVSGSPDLELGQYIGKAVRKCGGPEIDLWSVGVRVRQMEGYNVRRDVERRWGL